MAFLVIGQDYEGGVDNVSLSNAVQDIINFATTNAVPAMLTYLEVTAGTTSQNLMRVQMIRRTTASSVGTGTPTISPVDLQSGAAATTLLTNATTQGAGGAQFGSQQWNVAAPLEYDFSPGGILIPISGFLALSCTAAFGSALSVSIRFKFTELR